MLSVRSLVSKVKAGVVAYSLAVEWPWENEIGQAFWGTNAGGTDIHIKEKTDGDDDQQD